MAMADEIEMDVEVLLECLQCQKNDISAMKRTLLSLASVFKSNEESRDFFRLKGGLQYVHKLLFMKLPISVLQAAMFCLTCAVENNVFCQNTLTKPETFNFLHKMFSEEKSSPECLHAAVFFFTNLVAGNSVAQRMAKEQSLVFDLLHIFRHCEKKCRSSKRVCDEDLDLWSTVVIALSTCVNNPQNEVNQRLCCTVLPLCIQVVAEDRWHHLNVSLLSFVGLTVAGNGYNQNRVKKCGVLDTLLKVFQRCVQQVMEDLSEMQTAVGIVSVINACISDNEENATFFVSQDGVSMLMKLLTQPLQLTTYSLLQLVLALGHAGEYADKETTALTSEDKNALMQLLTKTEDEEVVRSVKYVLSIWQKQTTAAETENQGHEDLDKENVTMQQIKELLCSLGVNFTNEQNVLQKPDGEMINSASVAHGPHSQAVSPPLQQQQPSKTISQTLDQLQTSVYPQLFLHQRINDQPSVSNSLQHSGSSFYHQFVPGPQLQDQQTFVPPHTSSIAQGQTVELTGHIPLSAPTGFSWTTQAQNLNSITGLQYVSQYGPSQLPTVLSSTDPQLLQPPQLQPPLDRSSSVLALGSVAANRNLEQPRLQREQQQQVLWSNQVPTSEAHQYSHSVAQFKLPQPQLAQASETQSTYSQQLLEKHPLQTSPTQCSQLPVSLLSHQQPQQLETSSLPQLVQTRCPKLSQNLHAQLLPYDCDQLQPENTSLIPGCSLKNTPATSVEAEKSQERMAYHFFQKFLSACGAFQNDATTATNYEYLDRTEGVSSQLGQDADRSNETRAPCGSYFNSAQHHDTPPPGISVEQRQPTSCDSQQNLNVSLSCSRNSLRQHQHSVSSPTFVCQQEGDQTCLNHNSYVFGRLQPELNTAGSIQHDQEQSDLDNHFPDINHSRNIPGSHINSHADITNSMTNIQDTSACNSCHRERPKTYAICTDSEQTSVMTLHRGLKKTSIAKPQKRLETVPCSCHDFNFNTAKFTQVEPCTQQSSDLERDPVIAKSCDSNCSTVKCTETEPNVDQSSNPEKLRGPLQTKLHDSGNGPDCTYLPYLSKHSKHSNDFRVPLPKQSARRSLKSTKHTEHNSRYITDNTTSRIVRSPLWSATPIVRKGLRRTPSRTPIPQSSHVGTITSRRRLDDTLSQPGDTHRQDFTSQEVGCDTIQESMQSGRPQQNALRFSPAWSSSHHNVTLPVPPSPAASEYDCNLLKVAATSVCCNQKLLPKTPERNQANQFSLDSNSASGSCTTSRSVLPEWMRCRNGKGEMEMLSDVEDVNCLNHLCASDSDSRSLSETSSCISESCSVLGDCFIDLKETRGANENFCPGCNSMEPLNSHNFNIVIETSASTCSAHRKIRQIERDFIMNRASNRKNEKLSFQQWKNKMKGNNSDGNPGQIKKARHGQSCCIFDFSSSGSDRERVSPPYNDYSSVSAAKPHGGDKKSNSKARRHRLPYSDEEVQHLIKGVQQMGTCWQQILLTFSFHSSRTAVDLKDKYRQMQKQVRARKENGHNRNPPLSMCEERRLRRGVARLGHKWTAILQTGQFAHGRTAEELRDRWRVMSKRAKKNH